MRRGLFYLVLKLNQNCTSYLNSFCAKSASDLRQGCHSWSPANERVLFAAADVENIVLAVESLGIGKDSGALFLKVEIGRTRYAAEHSRGKNADVGKHIRRKQANVERLPSTHRQTAHCAVFRLGFGSVVLIDERHNVLNHLGAERLHTLCRIDRTACTARLNVAVGAHHNHWHGLAGGNQIVENVGQTPLLHPTTMVFAATVLNVNHWITVFALVVTGWRVNK